MSELLRMVNIDKSFGNVHALNNVSLTVNRGEVHALLGENGAGKTTLMNVLYGLYKHDAGDIYYNGELVDINEPLDAINIGVGMVHQHFMLIDELTVIENVVLGMDIKKKKFKELDLQAAAKQFIDLCLKYNMHMDPWMKVGKLTVGQRQRLEILKAMYRGSKLLILDEPTAVLIPSEIEELFAMIKQIISDGTTVIFISHKLNEIMTICDRVTVLRTGVLQETKDVKDTNKLELAKLMVGKEVFLTYDKAKANLKEEVLHIDHLSYVDSHNSTILNDVTFALRSGEILGIAGVDGNGQSELVECITGLVRSSSGTLEVCGKDATRLSPREILELQVGHIPEDRIKSGCIENMTLVDNLMLMNYYKRPYSKRLYLNWAKINADADMLLAKFNVKYGDNQHHMNTLSGGNQQKLVLAREINKNPKLLIAMHPVRGLDIGATEYVHQQLLEQRAAGAGVLLVSTELSDLFGLSDRIAVMYEGEIMGILSQEEFDIQRVGLMMAGTKLEDTNELLNQ